MICQEQQEECIHNQQIFSIHDRICHNTKSVSIHLFIIIIPSKKYDILLKIKVSKNFSSPELNIALILSNFDKLYDIIADILCFPGERVRFYVCISKRRSGRRFPYDVCDNITISVKDAT